MNQSIKRGFALFLVLVMCITFVPVFQLDVNSASTVDNNVTYKYDGKYVYNWGEREEVATFLSPMALEFYKKYNITYEDMANYDGGTSKNNVPSSEMYKELQSLMKKAHSHQTSYGETRPLYKYTDCENNGNLISSFYSGVLIGPAWDGGSTWNREHTWPNSKGLGGNDENDIMMLRPTSSSENFSRGNKAYGESGGYYFPNSESNGDHDVRGDVARIFLYIYIRWGNTSYAWGTSGVMECPEVLLEWMKEDPVDTWELGRNDSVQAITGTRNVFIDYPELAFVLFGEEIPSNMDTPSGMAKEENPSSPPDDNDCNHVYTNGCDKDCNNCGYVRTVNHSYDNDCDTDCNICSYTRTVKHNYDSLCDNSCNECGQTREPNHFYNGWKVIEKATNDAPGLEKRTCLYCRDVEERVIPKLDTPNDEKPSEPSDSDTSNDKDTDVPSQGENDGDGEQDEPIGFFEKIAQFFKNLFQKIASLFKKKK